MTEACIHFVAKVSDVKLMRMMPAVGLLIIYLLSFTSLAATVARVVAVTQFSIDFNPFAYMETTIDDINWIIIEMMIVIICANLPTMPAVVGRARSLVQPYLFSSPSHSGSGSSTFRSPQSPFSKWSCLHRVSDSFPSFPSFHLSANDKSGHYQGDPTSKVKLNEEKGVITKNNVSSARNNMKTKNNPQSLGGGFNSRIQPESFLVSDDDKVDTVATDTVSNSNLKGRSGNMSHGQNKDIYRTDEVAVESNAV